MIECLESRIAPAALFVNANTATYHDVDGDLVTVHFSKPILSHGDVGVVLTTAAGGNLGGEQLTAITLTGPGLAASPEGTSITITAKPQLIGGISHGDGLANVGSIDANDGNAKFDLGAVSVPGDLDGLSAGSSNSPTVGLASLTVGSLGYLGGGNTPLVFISGAAGAVKVKSDVVGMTVVADSFGSVTIGGDLRANAAGAGGAISALTLGQVTIGGDVRGGSASFSGIVKTTTGKLAGVTIGGSLLAGSATNSGEIISAGDMGLVKIGATVQSSIAASTGYIAAEGRLAGATIGGDFEGTTGAPTHGIVSARDLGLVRIGGEVFGATISSTGGKIGNVTIGSNFYVSNVAAETGLGSVTVLGDFNSTIQSGGALASVTLSGSMRGGSIVSHLNLGAIKINGDVSTGIIKSETGAIASVYINGSLDGSVAAGTISCATTLGPVVITRDVLGGSEMNSGSILAGTMSSVKIGGNLQGSGAGSGLIQGGHIAVVEIDHSVIGGSGANSGGISGTSLGTVRIGRNLFGGGVNSAFVESTGGDIGSVSVGGNVTGAFDGTGGFIQSSGNLGTVDVGGYVFGEGVGSGQIQSFGNLGNATIGGNLVGGFGAFAGAVISGGNLGSVKIGGSVTGGSGSHTGTIIALETLGSLTIGGDLVGGNLTDPNPDTSFTGYILGAHLPHVVIDGSVRAGVDTSTKGSLSMSGAIISVNEIGSLTVLGSLVGNVSSSGDLTTVFIGARGHANVSATATTDVAIASLHVAGHVEYANIVAGYDFLANAPNADAQIGTVKVDGNWIATNLVAGIAPGADGYGNANDAKLTGKDNADSRGAISKIASVIIGGTALGTASTSDGMTFGIEAQQLGSIHLGGALVPLMPGAKNDLFATAHPLGATLITQGITHADFNAFEVP